MKRALSLFLVFIMLFSAVCGLISCGSNVSIKDLDIVADTEKDSVSGLSPLPDTDKTPAPNLESVGVTVAELRTANDKSTVLKNYKNLLIKQSSYDASNTLKESEELFYAMDDSGKVTLDAVWFDSDGNENMLMNVVDGAMYTQRGDCLEFGIIPDTDYNISTASLFLSEPWDDIESVNLAKKDGKIVLSVSRTVTYDIDGENAHFTCMFTYLFDEQTYLISSYSYAYNINGKDTRRIEVSYTYGTEYEKNTEAYTAIAQADKKAELTFVSDDTIRKYSVAEDATVSVSDDVNGNQYTLYKNVGCTADIENVWEYISDFDDDTTVRLYIGQTGPDISFDYTLTQEHMTKFQSLVDAFVATALENSDKEAIEFAYEKLYDMLEFIEWQAKVGHIEYSDSKPDGRDKYIQAHEMSSDTYLARIEAFKKIYESNADYAKSIIFENWTDEDFEIFEKDNETVVDLNDTNNKLATDAYDITEKGSMNESQLWDTAAVTEIYTQMVENYNALAKLEGYDNYYDYASAEGYNRYYTAEELYTFRSYIKEYIAPLFMQIYTRLYEDIDNLNNSQRNQLLNLISTPYSKLTQNYVREYINSYTGSMNEKMSAMLDGGLTVFGTAASSPVTAYVSYSDYYETPFAFFSSECQDIMTIVHEMGHFVSMYYFNLGNTPYDTAETHSQGNEWMFLSYLKGKIDPKVYDVFVTYRLYSGLSTVVISTFVDEFEQIVYTSTTPVSDYEALARQLIEEYIGWDFFCEMGSYTPYEYIQLVTTQNPVYYLNYATSEIAAISFYVMASENYANAQEIYRKLQEDVTLGRTLIYTAKEIGLLSPLDESTYVKIQNLFGSTASTLMAA